MSSVTKTSGRTRKEPPAPGEGTTPLEPARVPEEAGVLRSSVTAVAAHVTLTPEGVKACEDVRARIATLEKHRNQWRVIAFRLYDAATQVLADNFDGRARTPLTKSWADLVAAVEQLEDSDVNDGSRP